MKTINEKECERAFGRFVKEGRERLGLYQSDVAEALGYTQSRISQLESGIKSTDLAGALELCQFLNLDLKEFIENYMKTLS